MKISYIVWFALLTACGQENMQQAKAVSGEKPYRNETLYRRMVEDVPVEDRKYLQDSMLVVPKASKTTNRRSEVLGKHRPKELKGEVHTYYLVAGSFASEEEAQLMINYFETESIPSIVLPHKNMKRVAIKLTMEEEEARQRMDSLNARFDGLVKFWFLQD